MDSAFSPFNIGYPMKRSPPPDFTAADTRQSLMHNAVAAAFVPHPMSLNSYLPPEVAMYHWTSQRESFLSHKLLAYYPALTRVPPYSSTDEEKPSQSYIGLIGKAILSSPQKKLVLSDIYNFILTHHPYFRNKGPGWRNSIRHNLSLNECFIKVGRSPNGKGHFWAINPANYEDFSKGEYRRKRAQRRNRGGTNKTAEAAACGDRKAAVKKEPAQKQEEQVRVRKAAVDPSGVERLNQRDTENRGFHIETLLSERKERPSKRSAFTFVVPTSDPVSHVPTSSRCGGFCGETLTSVMCSSRRK